MSVLAMHCRRFATVLCVAALAGCASAPPQGLEATSADAPTARLVQAEPDRHLGAVVRWGGEIIEVRNADTHTDIELYARPLFDNAEPRPDGGDQVRFIARAEGFLDPVEYAPGKRLTVRGSLLPAETRAVGEYPYRYPVVAVQASHLWPVYQPPADPAWYRDPFYDPWWPWGPWGPYRYWY